MISAAKLDKAMKSCWTPECDVFIRHASKLHCPVCEFFLSAQSIEMGECWNCHVAVNAEQRAAWVICSEICGDFAFHWKLYAQGQKHIAWRVGYVGIQGGVIRITAEEER